MFFTVKQCFRQVLGRCTSETMCFTRVQVEKSFWGAGFPVYENHRPPRCVEKVPYDFSLSRCGYRKLCLNAHVSLDNHKRPSAPKKNEKLERNNFPPSWLSVQEYFKLKRNNFVRLENSLLQNMPNLVLFVKQGWLETPLSQGGSTEKTHHRFLADKMRVSNLNTALRSTGTLRLWGFVPRNVVGDWSHGGQSPNRGWELYMAELGKPVGLTKISSGLFERFSST